MIGKNRVKPAHVVALNSNKTTTTKAGDSVDDVIISRRLSKQMNESNGQCTSEGSFYFNNFRRKSSIIEGMPKSTTVSTLNINDSLKIIKCPHKVSLSSNPTAIKSNANNEKDRDLSVCCCCCRQQRKTTNINDVIEDKPTVARGVLNTTDFLWAVPCLCPALLCRRIAAGRADDLLADTRLHDRWRDRRNALCDHMQPTMSQETRERIQKEIASRRTTLTWKLSQFFKAINSSDIEVDLT